MSTDQASPPAALLPDSVPAGGRAESPDQAAPPSRWLTASDQVQSTVRWLIAALAAVATVVFGAGPLVTQPTLDPRSDWLQLAVAALAGVAGLAGVVLLILTASRLLLPVEHTLGSLPRSYRDEVDLGQPEAVLPTGVASVQGLSEAIRRTRRSIGVSEMLALRLQREATARPDDLDLIARLVGLQDVLAIKRRNLDVYEATQDDILERGKLQALMERFTEHRAALVAWALVAAVGGIVFQLALTADDSEAEAAEPGPALGVLDLVDADEETAFLTAIGLSGCAVGDGAGGLRLPVIVLGGTGAYDDLYRVSTIPGSDCDATSFTVPVDLATVVVRPLATVTFPPPEE